jgi:hypothetical protein
MEIQGSPYLLIQQEWAGLKEERTGLFRVLSVPESLAFVAVVNDLGAVDVDDLGFVVDVADVAVFLTLIVAMMAKDSGFEHFDESLPGADASYFLACCQTYTSWTPCVVHQPERKKLQIRRLQKFLALSTETLDLYVENPSGSWFMIWTLRLIKTVI